MGDEGKLTWPQALAWRMRRQYLVERAPRAAMLDVVSRLCGVHAQLQSSAELALWPASMAWSRRTSSTPCGKNDLMNVVLDERCAMAVTIQATDLRRRVREVLNRVQEDREPVVVRTYETPQAVIIPYDDFQAYQAWQARRRERAAWLAELQAVAQEVSARTGLAGDEAAALIQEARRESRTS